MSDRLAVLGIGVDPSAAVAGTATVNAALKSTQIQSAKTTAMLKTQWASVGRTFAMVAGAAAGIGAGFTAVSALTEFAKFEQGMRNVAAVSSSTTEELRQLEEAALDMAIATRYNPEQTTQALYALASAGQSAQEAMATLPNVLALAEAGQADLAQATELVVSTMAQFGIAADDSQRVVDVLTAAIGDSAANVHRLQVGMAAAGPASNALNQSFEDTVAAVSILTTALGNGEMAGTGVKTILGQLAAESKKMGLDVWDASNNMIPLADIMEQIEERGIDVETIWKRLGLRGGPAMSALLEVGSDALRKQAENIRANGQAATVASSQLDTLSGDVDQLGSSADVFQVRFGRMFEGPAREAIQEVTRWIRDLTAELPTLSDEVGTFANNWGLVAGFIWDALDPVKEFIMKYTGLGWLLTDTSDKLKFLWASIRDFPINALTAVQLFADEFKYHMSSMGYYADEVFLAMGLAWNYLWNRAQVVFAKFKDWLQEKFNSIKEFLRDLIYAMADSLEKLPFDFGVDWAVNVKKAADSLLNLEENTDDVTTAVEALDKEWDKIKKNYDEERAKSQALQQQRRDAHVENIDQILQERDRTLDMLKDVDNELEEVVVTAKRRTLEVEKTQENMVDNSEEEYERMHDAWAETLEDMIDELEKMEQEVARIWEDIKKDMDMGDITTLLAEAGRAGFEQGPQAAWNMIKKGWKDNKAGFVAGTANLATEFFERNEAYNEKNALGLDPYGGSMDGTLRALADTILPIVAMMGPWGAAIAAVIGLVDSISGGKLFGTAYELVESGINIGLSASGVTGGQYTKEERERSFFRGTKTRITESDLDAEVIQTLMEMFETIEKAMIDTARAIGTGIPEMIEGTFEQEFDKNGNITRSVSKVLGKTYEEDLEQFGKRLAAENILAVLAQKVGDVAVTTTSSNYPWGGDWGGDLGRSFRGYYGDDDDFSGGIHETTTMVNEVQAIADRWRDNADLLLEGAGYLLLAIKDMDTGYNILTDGSLTEVTDLVEELNFAGETLAETYQKMVFSVNNLEKAMMAMGMVVEDRTEEFVTFATQISDAAGGVQRANELWNSFFTTFFSESEQAVIGLTDNMVMMNRAQGDIDAAGVTFANFRESFQQVLETGSPEEVAKWLAFGEAMGKVNEAMGGFGVTAAELLDTYTTADDFTSTLYTMNDALDEAQGNLDRAMDAYDGTVSAEAELMVAMRDRYMLEVQYMKMVEAAAESIRDTLSSTIEMIKLSVMTSEGQYNYLKQRAEELGASLIGMTDPDEIRRTVDEIDSLTRQAYGLLSPEQKLEMAGEFIEFLEGINELAQNELEKLRLDMDQDRQDNIDRMELIFESFNTGVTDNVSNMQTAANNMQDAAETMQDAAQTLVSTPIQIHVTTSSNPSTRYEQGVA